MRKIDLTKPPEHLTCFIYGPTRSGKTQSAASFPKPRFLSDTVEAGYETIRNLSQNNRAAFYDANVLPEVWGVESPKDMMDAVAQTKSEVLAKSPNAPLTIVIDSATYYSNLFFDAAMRAEPQGREDTRKIYGMLLTHMRKLLISVHEIPINVVWLALNAPVEDNTMSGPLISGKSAMILPAACHYYFYMNKFNESIGQGKSVEKFEWRTHKFGPYPAGGRDGGTLPDPLEPNYKSLIKALTTVQQQPQKPTQVTANK